MQISTRQLGYLNDLLAQRPQWAARRNLNDAALSALSMMDASNLIDAARSAPREMPQEQEQNPANRFPSDAAAMPLAQVVEGSYWTTTGKIARVRKGRNTGRLYAEELVEIDPKTVKFEYSKGLIFHLKRRMTLEEAKAWGARHGICCICAATLTDSKSIDAGIGPVCAKKV